MMGDTRMANPWWEVGRCLGWRHHPCRTPSSRYTPSPHPYPERLPPLEYQGHFLVKRVTKSGTFLIKHKLLFIANDSHFVVHSQT